MFQPWSKEPETRPSGCRLIPPSVPPAPPAGPPKPPPSNPNPPPPPPDPSSRGSGSLGCCLQECFAELALIRTSFETLTLFSAPEDFGLEVEMRALIEGARIGLIHRLQEIDRRVSDGPTGYSDGDLLGFHRAMMDVIRRGVRFGLLDTSIYGTEASSADPSGAFRYSLPPRHPQDDPSTDAPAALVRRIVVDLVDELSSEDNLASGEQFDRCVYHKFKAVLYACFVGESLLLTDE